MTYPYNFEVRFYNYETDTYESEYLTEFADCYLDALKKVIKKYDCLHGVAVIQINNISPVR